MEESKDEPTEDIKEYTKPFSKVQGHQRMNWWLVCGKYKPVIVGKFEETGLLLQEGRWR